MRVNERAVPRDKTHVVLPPQRPAPRFFRELTVGGVTCLSLIPSLPPGLEKSHHYNLFTVMVH